MSARFNPRDGLVSDVKKIMVEDGCDPCEQVKRELAPEIARGEIVLVPTSSEEAQRVAVAHNVEYVPYPYEVRDDGSLGRCELRRGPDGRIVVECESEEPAKG